MKKFLSLFVMLIVSVVAMADGFTPTLTCNVFDDCYSDYAFLQYADASAEEGWSNYEAASAYSEGTGPLAAGTQMRVVAYCNPEEGDPQHYIASVTVDGAEISCTSGPDEDKRYYYNFTLNSDAAVVVTFSDQAPTPVSTLNFVCNPADGSTVESIKKVVVAFPDYDVADIASAMLADCIKNEAGETLGAASLSYADDMNALTWEYGNEAITTPGTYTITIPAGAVTLGDGENMEPTTQDVTFSLTVGEAADPELQMTYPQANTTVNELPDYVTFMFDKEVQQPYACAIQLDENDPVTIEPVDITVIDGNTVKFTLTDKTKEQISGGNGGITAYVWLKEETQHYDTYFTVAAEFGVKSNTLGAEGGQVFFNDNIDFVDPENVTCYVSAVKTKNIATQATFALNDDDYTAIDVTFADKLEPGDYTLDIPEGMIKSTSEEPLASVKVAFTVQGEPVNFTSNPANDAIVSEIDKVTLIFPDVTVADINTAILADCVTNASGEAVCAGSLTYNWDGGENELIWQAGSKITEEGTYTIRIPAGAITLGDGETMTPTESDMVIVLTVSNVPAEQPELQMTYPEANTTVNELPEYVTFMFNQEITSVYACAIQNGYDDPVVIDPADYTVIDGNTVKMTLTDKTKEQLGEISSDGVTVYVQLTEDWQYDTHFFVAPEFAAEEWDLSSTGGKVWFNQHIDFVDGATEVKCYVSAVKTKNIATQATLTLDDSYFNCVDVEFADVLPAGDYTLDIPEGVIMSTSEEPLASCKLEFTVEGETPDTPLKTLEMTYTDIDPEWPNYNDPDWGMVEGAQFTVEFYEGNSIVIKDWMNQGMDLCLTYDPATGDILTANNPGDLTDGTWAYMDADMNYWCYVDCDAAYPGSTYSYYYEPDEQIYFEFATGGYWYNYNLKYVDPAGINNVNAEANVNSDATFNLAGQRVNASSKGIVIVNGKKYLNK